MYSCTYKHTCTCAHIHTHTRARAHTHKHTHACVHTHKHTRLRAHTYIHTNTHACTCIHTHNTHTHRVISSAQKYTLTENTQWTTFTLISEANNKYSTVTFTDHLRSTDVPHNGTNTLACLLPSVNLSMYLIKNLLMKLYTNTLTALSPYIIHSYIPYSGVLLMRLYCDELTKSLRFVNT